MCELFGNDLWVEENFNKADFNDERLSHRLKIITKGMVKNPEGSIPEQMGNWNDVKSCYNFLSNKKVSHTRIQTPHRERVKKICEQLEIVLFMQDTSELDYSNLIETTDLGYIGNHKNKGIMIHSCLAIESNEQNPTILGLANQQIWKREHLSLNKHETRTQRNKRERESQVWLNTLKAIGSPCKNSMWVSVGDRANDIYEFFVGSEQMNWESVVRVKQDRKIKIEEETTYIMTHMKSLPSVGKKIIRKRREKDTKASEVELEVAWDQVTLEPPKRLEGKMKAMTISIIRCWNEEEEIEWILYSSIPVNCLAEAIEKIEWYSKRWIIEEYHKCLKTGCRVEESQLESSKGLEALVAILGIIAITMLELRSLARENPSIQAHEVVTKEALDIVCKRFKLEKDITLRVFWHSIAKLGGFLGRKSDGEPGWQTLWNGWLRFLDMLWGYSCLT